MTRNASDHAGSFNAIKRNPSSSSSKSSSELEEMRQLFKSNRESLRSIEKVIMLRCSFLSLFCNREFENSPQLRRSRVHFAGILSETTQMQMSSTFMPDRLLNKCLFYDLFFTDSPCCTDGGNMGWGQLQLLHAASLRLRSPQSPPKPQPMLLRAPYHHDNRFSHTDDRPLTPVGTEVQRKYQRMLALVEER